MAGYIFKGQKNYGFTSTFEAAGKYPLIANRIFETYDNALGFVNNYYSTAVPGLVLSVIKDNDNEKNGIYFVAKVASEKGANDGELQKVGSDVKTSIEATNYSDAVNLSTGLTVGTIINITREETIYDENDTGHLSGETVSPGLYIVTGPGAVASLSTSPAGETDYGTIISSLQGEVSTLKEELVKLSSEQKNDDKIHIVEGDDANSETI